MTSLLMTENYGNEYSDLCFCNDDNENHAIKIRGNHLLYLIFRLKGLSDFEIKITEIYTYMFTCI